MISRSLIRKLKFIPLNSEIVEQRLFYIAFVSKI